MKEIAKKKIGLKSGSFVACSDERVLVLHSMILEMISLFSTQQQFLVSQANNATNWQNFWIGLNDRNDEGGYVWADGTPVTYTNWSTHQPNDWNGAQDCVEVLLYGSSTLMNTWNDLSCAATRPFVCEYPVGKCPWAMDFQHWNGLCRIIAENAIIMITM